MRRASSAWTRAQPQPSVLNPQGISTTCLIHHLATAKADCLRRMLDSIESKSHLGSNVETTSSPATSDS